MFILIRIVLSSWSFLSPFFLGVSGETQVPSLSPAQLTPAPPSPSPIVLTTVFKHPALIPARLSYLRFVRWHSVTPSHAASSGIRFTNPKCVILYMPEPEFLCTASCILIPRLSHNELKPSLFSVTQRRLVVGCRLFGAESVL